MDVAIVVLVSGLALALHVGLSVLIRRWIDRDLALSFASGDADRQAYMLRHLAVARREGVGRRALPAWLEAAAVAYRGPAAGPPVADQSA